jgi:ATP-dependent Clp protease ATP-binding subunit ClpC
LRGVVDRYEEHHEVRYRDEALDACVRLADRYIRDRHLPDKALGVLDLAGSRAARKGLTDVTADMVARVVADITGVPEERLLLSDTERLLRMEQELGRNIIGHRHVLTRIADVIRRNYAGFAGQRPMGSFLFLGPSGVGKTETARALASYLFGTDEAVTRIDMAEYSEAHAVARFVGAPPGYVGHEEGGQLTEAVRRRPFHIVLLDEIEKAHRDVLQLLLQVLDEGRLTDGRGRVVQFSNTVVILTSNLGGQAIFDTMDSQTGGIGFASGARRRAGAAGEEDPGADEALIEAALEAAERSLVPELWNRIEERLVFLPLKRHEIEQIARLLLARTAERLRAERGVQLEADDAVIDALIAGGGFNARLGARPMRQTIQRLVEAPLAERILAGDVTSGDVVHARVEDGAIVFTRAS